MCCPVCVVVLAICEAISSWPNQEERLNCTEASLLGDLVSDSCNSTVVVWPVSRALLSENLSDYRKQLVHMVR